jgi:hypothetical protein
VVKLKSDLGGCAGFAWLHSYHVAYQLRSLGDVGPIGYFHGRFRLDDDVVAGLGGLGVQFRDQFTLDWT